MPNILNLLHSGLHACNAKNTANNLGDRSTYIGMSDIAKSVDCMRSVVAEKLNALSDSPDEEQLVENIDMDSILRFQRGHWFEAGIVSAFKQCGLPLFSQLTIEDNLKNSNSLTNRNILHHKNNLGVKSKITSKNKAVNIPIKAHLDLVIISPDEPIHVQIIEIKSCANMPDIAYSTYEVQLFGQMGLLKKNWYKPCFKDSESKQIKLMSFPDLVHKKWGIKLPDMADVIIEGSLLLVSMNDIKILGQYEPNEIMLNVCTNLANDIWYYIEAVQSGQITLADVPTAKGFHALCEYCQHNSDCPRFEGVTMPELEQELLNLSNLKSIRDKNVQQVKKTEEQLKHLFQGISPNNDWVNAVTQRFRMGICDGRKSLDKERLLSALVAHMPLDNAETIIAAGQKVGAPYERLYVGTIN